MGVIFEIVSFLTSKINYNVLMSTACFAQACRSKPLWFRLQELGPHFHGDDNRGIGGLKQMMNIEHEI